MDSFLENLKEYVQCVLCNDRFTEPKISSCFHTFCKPCIKRNAELTEKAENVFKCPKCKSLTPLPELNTGVEDLKPSLVHSRILELLEFLKKEKVCSVCERKPKATWYSLDRQRLLCEDCAKTNSIINKEQQNISLFELTEADIERILKRESLCQDHEQVYEFFCKNCQEFICIHCFRSRQCRAHETVAIIEGSVQDFFVKEGKEKLKLKEEEIQKKIEQRKEIILSTKKDGERAKAKIEETVKHLTEMLQKYKQELDEHIDQRIKEAERKSQKDQEKLFQIGRALDYIDELKNNGVVSEIRQATQNIEVYVDQSSNTATVSPNMNDDTSRFKFVISDECSRFLHSKQGLGSLKQVDMTTAIHVDPELEAMKEAKLTLEATEKSSEKHKGVVCKSSDVAIGPAKTSLEKECKDSRNGGKKDEIMKVADDRLAAVASEETNHISMSKTAREKLIDNDPRDVVEVKISPEENVEIKENYVRADGKLEVEFIPKVVGQLTVEVQVNGNHVSNSPLVINVKPQKMRIAEKFDTKLQAREKSLTRFASIAVNEDNSRIAVTDWSTHCVRVFNTHGHPLLTYDRDGQLRYPHGLAFLNEIDLVIADCNNDRIYIVNTTTGTLVNTFGNHGKGDGKLKEPHGVHVDDDGNIIVCDHDNHRVQVFTRDGDYQYQFGLESVEHFSPIALLKIQDKFYVSDFTNNVIQVFEEKGSVVSKVSTIGRGEGSADGQLSGPCGLAIDKDHHLLVCDNGNNRIQKFTLDGRLVGKTYDKIEKPYEIAVGKDEVLTASTVSSKILTIK